MVEMVMLTHHKMVLVVVQVVTIMVISLEAQLMVMV